MDYLKDRLEKLNYKIVLIETLALFSIIIGIQRLFLGFQGDRFNAVLSNDTEKYYILTSIP